MSPTLAPPTCDAAAFESRPFVDGRKTLCNGVVSKWEGAVQEVFAPISKVRRQTARRRCTRDHCRQTG